MEDEDSVGDVIYLLEIVPPFRIEWHITMQFPRPHSGNSQVDHQFQHHRFSLLLPVRHLEKREVSRDGAYSPHSALPASHHPRILAVGERGHRVFLAWETE